MDKEEILKLSREENNDVLDEREILAYGNAARFGGRVGGIICFILTVIFSRFFNMPEVGLAVFIVFFGMQAAGNFALYKELRLRHDLIYGLLATAFTIGIAIALAIRVWVSL
ncbi:MAG: hypothetical protein E7241_02425 [Lachnospiraceae bacterium]|jgi:hypothetical protein|nr:hypothetical protein [Lachnospiraceae bacterium]